MSIPGMTDNDEEIIIKNNKIEYNHDDNDLLKMNYYINMNIIKIKY